MAGKFDFLKGAAVFAVCMDDHRLIGPDLAAFTPEDADPGYVFMFSKDKQWQKEKSFPFGDAKGGAEIETSICMVSVRGHRYAAAFRAEIHGCKKNHAVQILDSAIFKRQRDICRLHGKKVSVP
jgi:hypothetical protein